MTTLDEVKLAAAALGQRVVPLHPTEAMLRPFMGCPDDELGLAYDAMLSIARSSILGNPPSGGGVDG